MRSFSEERSESAAGGVQKASRMRIAREAAGSIREIPGHHDICTSHHILTGQMEVLLSFVDTYGVTNLAEGLDGSRSLNGGQ